MSILQALWSQQLAAPMKGGMEQVSRGTAKTWKPIWKLEHRLGAHVRPQRPAQLTLVNGVDRGVRSVWGRRGSRLWINGSLPPWFGLRGGVVAAWDRGLSDDEMLETPTRSTYVPPCCTAHPPPPQPPQQPKPPQLPPSWASPLSPVELPAGVSAWYRRGDPGDLRRHAVRRLWQSRNGQPLWLRDSYDHQCVGRWNIKRAAGDGYSPARRRLVSFGGIVHLPILRFCSAWSSLRGTKIHFGVLQAGGANAATGRLGHNWQPRHDRSEGARTCRAVRRRLEAIINVQPKHRLGARH